MYKLRQFVNLQIMKNIYHYFILILYMVFNHGEMLVTHMDKFIKKEVFWTFGFI